MLSRRWLATTAFLVLVTIVLIVGAWPSSESKPARRSEAMVLQAGDLEGQGWTQESPILTDQMQADVAEEARSLLSWTDDSTTIAVEVELCLFNTSSNASDMFQLWHTFAQEEMNENESYYSVLNEELGDGSFIAIVQEYPASAWAALWTSDVLVYMDFNDASGQAIEPSFIRSLLAVQLEKVDLTRKAS